MVRWFIIVPALTLILLLLAVIVSATMFGQCSAGGTLASGRSISVNADSWRLNVAYAADTATIDTGCCTIVVAPTVLKIDGRTVGRLDATVKAVTVSVKDDEVTFVADGKLIGNKKR